jgi:hypothetical protein
MKKTAVLFSFFIAIAPLQAHDHVEVGKATSASTQLAMSGPSYQLAVYVPKGEPFSGYMPQFPGGYHAAELTFTTDVNALFAAADANPRIDLVSVSGPAGGNFSFWEAGATQPSWTRMSGWSSAQGNIPSFMVIIGGDIHVHGRCFTMDKPGTYTVTFRAVDAAGKFTTSSNKTITFKAQQPPQMSIAVQGKNAHLSFTARTNLVYDLQASTNISLGPWANVEPHTFMDGYGTSTNLTVTNATLLGPNTFFRLVEYY